MGGKYEGCYFVSEMDLGTYIGSGSEKCPFTVAATQSKGGNLIHGYRKI